VVYVAQTGTDTIGVFAADDGRRLRTLGEGYGAGDERQLSGPTDVALSADGGTLYIADHWNHRVAVWQSADGAHVRSIGSGEGSGPGQLRRPCGLVLSPDGWSLFVVETGNHRVSLFEPLTGRFLRSWGQRGSTPDELNEPRYCALSRDGGVLFVTDGDNCRVVAFDVAAGSVPRVPRCFGREGSGDGELKFPHGLALSRCGRELYVADGGNHRVVVLSSADGSALRSWRVEGHPLGVDLGPDGRLFVASFGSHSLRKFS
jgi:DNA-binding beta-propeller fold protein YncE